MCQHQSKFAKTCLLSEYLNQEEGTASFPGELRKLLRNKFFEKEVLALQKCIAAGAVVRTPGVDWQRSDVEVRDDILHLCSAEEGAEGTRTSGAELAGVRTPAKRTIDQVVASTSTCGACSKAARA